jgi:hypothetical protein
MTRIGTFTINDISCEEFDVVKLTTGVNLHPAVFRMSGTIESLRSKTGVILTIDPNSNGW